MGVLPHVTGYLSPDVAPRQNKTNSTFGLVEIDCASSDSSAEGADEISPRFKFGVSGAVKGMGNRISNSTADTIATHESNANSKA